MQTAELLDLMNVLKLRGMRAAFEEILSEGLKRKLSFHQILGKLFACEIEERKLRSIRYQLDVANLPMTKSLDSFQFAGTPINEALVRQWHEGLPLASARNLILVGGTGTGKTHGDRQPTHQGRPPRTLLHRPRSGESAGGREPQPPRRRDASPMRTY